MNISEAIEYLRNDDMPVILVDKDKYKITNPQNVSLYVTKKGIINYAEQLQYDKKMEQIEYWKR